MPKLSGNKIHCHFARSLLVRVAFSGQPFLLLAFSDSEVITFSTDRVTFAQNSIPDPLVTRSKSAQYWSILISIPVYWCTWHNVMRLPPPYMLNQPQFQLGGAFLQQNQWLQCRNSAWALQHSNWLRDCNKTFTGQTSKQNPDKSKTNLGGNVMLSWHFKFNGNGQWSTHTAGKIFKAGLLIKNSSFLLVHKAQKF